MDLLDRIREHLGSRDRLATDRSGAPADIELEAATAILLLEAAYGDTEYAWSEHHALLKGLEHAFGLGRKETLSLLDRAEEIRPPIVRLEDVTNVIRERFDLEQRREVVKLIWRVIDADDVVEEWEAGFADHVARAVGLSAADAAAVRASALAD